MSLSRRKFLQFIGLGAATAAIPATASASRPRENKSTWSTSMEPIDDAAGQFEPLDASPWDEVLAADGQPYTQRVRPDHQAMLREIYRDLEKGYPQP